MRSLSGSLAVFFMLATCAPLSKHASIPGVAENNTAQREQETASQQEQYDAWWQSLTPKQRVTESQHQHERALSP